MNADNPLVSIIGVTVRQIDFRGVRLRRAGRGRGSLCPTCSYEITKRALYSARSPFVANYLRVGKSLADTRYLSTARLSRIAGFPRAREESERTIITYFDVSTG